VRHGNKVGDIAYTLRQLTISVSDTYSTGSKILHYLLNRRPKSRQVWNLIIPLHVSSPRLLLESSANTAAYVVNKPEIDLIITLGGDGTILHANSMFNTGPVPPVLSFSLGTLGFLLPFRESRIV
jgi:NAD kinase